MRAASLTFYFLHVFTCKKKKKKRKKTEGRLELNHYINRPEIELSSI